MSENLKLGQLIDTEQQRDAIHIAVAPCVAGADLMPGMKVALVDGKATPSTEPIGVVDPFLTTSVPKGARFWLYLTPGSITSLRHEWTHPELDQAYISSNDHITKSRAWIAEHAKLLGLSTDALMEDADHWLWTEDHRIQNGSERWRDNFNPTEFWHHYEVVTGKTFPEDKKRTFYCCSC